MAAPCLKVNRRRKEENKRGDKFEGRSEGIKEERWKEERREGIREGRSNKRRNETRRKEGMKDEIKAGGRGKEIRWIKNKIGGKRKCKRTK